MAKISCKGGVTTYTVPQCDSAGNATCYYLQITVDNKGFLVLEYGGCTYVAAEEVPGLVRYLRTRLERLAMEKKKSGKE